MTAASASRHRQPGRSITSRQVMLFSAIGAITLFVVGVVGWLIYEQTELFGRYLDTYLSIHRFRVQLAESERALNRFFRERSDDDLNEFRDQSPELWLLYRSLQRHQTAELDDYFQLRAIQFGLMAYLSTGTRAAGQLQAGEPDAFASFVTASRIRDYLDQYAERLLQVRLTVGEREFQTLSRQSRGVVVAAAIALLLLGAAMISFAILFARTVSRPLVSLSNTAEQIAAGDLDAPVIRVNSGDEIETLTEAFAVMQQNIKQLIRDLEGKQELELRAARLTHSLREAQLIGLQSQMNPHFLFNTLNTISRTAMFEDASETTDLIRSLARVFRYMLQEPHATVTLKEELQIVEEYVKLQRHRFHERLSFVLHCEVDPVAVRIPALTLQPLVENAIRHGIEPKEEGGTVTVTCRMAADRMSIAVADDGVGMEHPTSEPTGDHIGLNNVHTRLQLLHGDELEFSFLSEVGVGTTVTIAFPAERREG